MHRTLILGAGIAASVLRAAPARAQRLSAVEGSAGGVIAAARHSFAGASLGAGYRPGGQTRLAFGAAAGTEAGRTALRVALSAQFLVTPAARRGIGLYGGLGIAGRARRGRPGATYLAVLLGIEHAPGRPAGWYGEVGLGGGVHVAAGWRWRRFPPWWGASGR